MDIQEKMIFKSREDEAKERSKKVAQELHQAARDKKIKDMLHSIHHAHEKTMSEDTEHLGNVVGLVANHDFTGATEIVHDLLNQRVVGALDEYKRTVAQNLFSPIPRELEEEKDQYKFNLKDPLVRSHVLGGASISSLAQKHGISHDEAMDRVFNNKKKSK
jgi:hypothetical protein